VFILKYHLITNFQYSLLIFAPVGVLCLNEVVLDVAFDYLSNGITFVTYFPELK
jgi:hypothetical protein